jgi:hypothetical protein
LQCDDKEGEEEEGDEEKEGEEVDDEGNDEEVVIVIRLCTSKLQGTPTGCTVNSVGQIYWQRRANATIYNMLLVY